MGSPRVVGIVLAAGSSSRMGRTKQLLPFRGQTILECVVDTALSSALHRTLVVLGYQADTLAPLLSTRAVTVINNPAYAQGQGSSVKAGLQSLTEDDDAALFLLGDQPLVSADIIDQLLAAYAATPSPVVMPVFKGRRGNPVLFSRETFPRMAELDAECGARPLIEEYAERVLKVPVLDPHIHFDIDTKEDYQRLLNL
jgi:molybdenum cofactor cytidylyltransferase